jgi:hypothetical protein
VSRPTLQEVDFQAFKRALERSIANGTRITPADKERWERYVAERGIREVNVKAYAAGKYPNLACVIIDDPNEGGYFLWSGDEEVALRWHKPG